MEKKIRRAKAAFAYGGSGVADPRTGETVSTNDLGASKGKRKEAHTAPTKFGMGDYYGTGLKAKIGRMRSSSMSPDGVIPVSRKQLKTPPKSVV